MEIKSLPNNKQRLYEKFLKTRSQKNELEYKNYKNLFDTIKKMFKEAALFKINY